MRLTALLDANVLYPATTRSVLMYLAIGGVFHARWTAAIQDEWTQSLLDNRPDLKPERIARTRELMDSRVPDALVTGYQPLIASLTLPDSNDRHVLAAAIQGGASVIVTKNLKDFPTAQLSQYGIIPQHPDDFLCALLDAEPATVVAAFAMDRANLLTPPISTDSYLAALEQNDLSLTADALRAVADRL